jgi:clan AA aspartic protease
MGVFHQAVEIRHPSRRGRGLDLDALVDTGATYTWIPAPLLRRIGIKASETRPFRMADGRVVNRKMGEAVARVKGKAVRTLVVFGDPGSEPLLGAYTLEGAGLTVDSIHRELVPVAAYAVGFTHPTGRKPSSPR